METLDKDYLLMVESRLTKEEILSSSIQEDILEIKRDLRWMFGIMITINCAILGAVAHGLNII